jgi:hypothetical protein
VTNNTAKDRAGRFARVPAPERFWKFVEVTESCWLWRGSIARGYGKFTNDEHRPVPAHRFGYELMVGPIPAGLQIDHLCRVRNCVNPDHLEVVTQRENIMRGETVPATNAAKTHCPQGHEYTPENTAISRWGRRCRKCSFIRKRLKRQRARTMSGPDTFTGAPHG